MTIIGTERTYWVSLKSAVSENRTPQLIVVPVTGDGNFARAAGFTVSLDDAGTKTTGVIRRDQPRTIDMEAQNGKRLEKIPAAIMNEVLARLS